MVVSHLDVCSELVALAVRCGAAVRTRTVPCSLPSGRRRGARRTGRADGRARRADWRLFRIRDTEIGVEMSCGVLACAAARCKLTMHPTHNPWL